jgi:hypothetical protein
MKKCRDKDCKTSHCLSSRCVLNHYRMCKNANTTSTCEVCAPVMHQVKMEQISNEASDAALKEDSQEDSIPSKLPASPNGPRAALNPDSTEQKRRQLEGLEDAQQKLQQQQTLLKQLNQQQTQLLEKQERLRQEQQHVQPQTEQGIQLQQQQVLLQDLHDLFQQQQLLLQEEVTRQSQPVQDVHALPDVHAAMEPVEGVGRTSPVLEGPSSLSRQSEPQRARGGKGKYLKAMAPAASERRRSVAKTSDGADDSVPPSRKRAADRNVNEPELDSTGDTRSSKVARGEKSDPRPKVLQQGNADHTTSLIQSMSVTAVERHLASLNDKLHITPQTIMQRCHPILRKLIDDQFGWVFSDPVDPVALALPDYFDIVKNPMHLTLVEEKLRRGDYHNVDSFAQDTRLVFDNAILYNGEDSEVGKMAALMLRLFERDLKAVQKGE